MRVVPVYQLNYLSRPGAHEIVDVEGPDEAEDMARRRLLFSEPGFAIAIVFEGVELNRVTQRSKAPRTRSFLSDRAGRSPGGPVTPSLDAAPQLSEQHP
ncbi:hypothetical protein BrevBR_06340 [Brevundimonas sp. BR2-1]|uniref:hypothetical protein n=1 Tax=Brevundimonas sp. BR2-1 TaxID=3031123 RepID=UPI003098E3E4